MTIARAAMMGECPVIWHGFTHVEGQFAFVYEKADGAVEIDKLYPFTRLRFVGYSDQQQWQQMRLKEMGRSL